MAVSLAASLLLGAVAFDGARSASWAERQQLLAPTGDGTHAGRNAPQHRARATDHADTSKHDPYSSDSFCDAQTDGCWPKYFLLGTEWCETGAIAKSLIDAGVVAVGSGSGDAMALDSSAKGPHAFDDYFHTFASQPSEVYTKLFRPVAQGGASGFLDATPNYFSDIHAPEHLSARMPMQLLTTAKFVVVIREPIARALAWYVADARHPFACSRNISIIVATARSPRTSPDLTLCVCLSCCQVQRHARHSC